MFEDTCRKVLCVIICYHQHFPIIQPRLTLMKCSVLESSEALIPMGSTGWKGPTTVSGGICDAAFTPTLTPPLSRPFSGSWLPTFFGTSTSGSGHGLQIRGGDDLEVVAEALASGVDLMEVEVERLQ